MKRKILLDEILVGVECIIREGLIVLPRPYKDDATLLSEKMLCISTIIDTHPERFHEDNPNTYVYSNLLRRREYS